MPFDASPGALTYGETPHFAKRYDSRYTPSRELDKGLN